MGDFTGKDVSVDGWEALKDAVWGSGTREDDNLGDGCSILSIKDPERVRGLKDPNDIRPLGPYALTVRSACRHLLITRATFSAAVRPHLDRLRVGGRMLSTDPVTGLAAPVRHVSWASMLQRQGAISSDNRAFYSVEQYARLLRTHSTVERRTRRVPYVSLALPGLAGEYLDSTLRARDRYSNEVSRAWGDEDAINKLTVEFQDALRIIRARCLDPLHAALEGAAVSEVKRTDVPWCAVSDSAAVDPAKAKLSSLSSLRDWGEADESVYRRLFRLGSWRVTFELPKKGGVAKLVRYVDDPWEVDGRGDSACVAWSTHADLLAAVERRAAELSKKA